MNGFSFSRLRVLNGHEKKKKRKTDFLRHVSTTLWGNETTSAIAVGISCGVLTLGYFDCKLSQHLY
jgi:hypothetical protein